MERAWREWSEPFCPGAGRVIMQTMRALQNAAREARMAPMAPLRLRMNAMRSSFSPPPRGSVAQATPRAPLGTRGGVRKKWSHQSRRSVGVRIQWVEQALPTTTAGSSAPTMAQPAHQAGSLSMVPPSMPYEQWRAGYDNACEEARRSCRTPTQLAAESSSSNPATDAVYSQHTRRAAAADLALLMPRESIAKCWHRP